MLMGSTNSQLSSHHRPPWYETVMEECLIGKTILVLRQTKYVSPNLASQGSMEMAETILSAWSNFDDDISSGACPMRSSHQLDVDYMMHGGSNGN